MLAFHIALFKSQQRILPLIVVHVTLTDFPLFFLKSEFQSSRTVVCRVRIAEFTDLFIGSLSELIFISYLSCLRQENLIRTLKICHISFQYVTPMI